MEEFNLIFALSLVKNNKEKESEGHHISGGKAFG